jgi:cobyrinic acid a,c-diamide synthase
MEKTDTLAPLEWKVGSLIISSPQGRSGKTVVTIGLCRLFVQNGYKVQPFKKGPDYIDPSWLTLAAHRTCRNLDLFLIPRESLIENFRKNCLGMDIAIIEGAMGLYDGLSAKETTAEIAHLFNIPILMVINTTRMAESISAMIMGYQNFRSDIYIAGIILNYVSGARHESKLRNAVEKYCKIPVVGSIPKDINLNIPERHLGLIPSEETRKAESIVDLISQRLNTYLDLNGILMIAKRFNTPNSSLFLQGARRHNELHLPQVEKEDEETSYTLSNRMVGVGNLTSKIKIGVLRDQAFNFYYPENIEALEEKGAEIIYINSLRDSLPQIDALYIGGGFPEFFLEELEKNNYLRRDIANAIEGGLPVYAECAGLMYLCQRNYWEGKSYEMVGVIPAEVQISKRPEAHGYVMVETEAENPFFPKGTTILGHEFHHSKLLLMKEVKFVFKIKRGHGIDGKKDGILYKNMFATYIHIHSLGVPQWAEAFISLAKRR